MTARLLFTAILGLVGSTAFAMENPCWITHDEVLSGPSIVKCVEFKMEPGVRIITQGFEFRRDVDGAAVLGSLDKPGRVICQDPNDTRDIRCGDVTISAFSTGGGLVADLQAAFGQISGAVRLATHGFETNNFLMKAKTGEGGYCAVLVNGLASSDCAINALN